MAERDYSTLTEILADTSAEVLRQVRQRLTETLDDLNNELRLVDRALAKKGEATQAVAVSQRVSDLSAASGRTTLRRADLLRFVKECGQPVRATDMRDRLAAMGINRSPEAIRNGLVRLVGDGSLVRTDDGRFAVPSENGNGSRIEAETPAMESRLESSGSLPGV